MAPRPTGARKKAVWLRALPLELLSWTAMTAGIVARQGIDVEDLSWAPGSLSLAHFCVSFVIALAVLPWASRGVAKLHPHAGLEVIAFPFSFGFFLDLTALAALHWVLHAPAAPL